MKMINDMDMYYANTYARAGKPAWMKAERMDFCETSADHKAGSFFRTLLHRKDK